MTPFRMTWQAVRDELDRDYAAHDGYLPHHAERKWAPRLGIKPNSVRSRFTNDLKRENMAHSSYRLTPLDLALIAGTPSSSKAFDQLRLAGRNLPPFGPFVQALWSARRPDMATFQATMDRCPDCRTA